MNFTAIDFETAHAQFPCEIGLCKVENGEIVESYSRFIKPACFPYMNPWCQKVHGISSLDLQDALVFDDLWSELHFWLEDTVLLAHNATFDMGVLRSVLRYYDLAIPHSDYACSLALSRKVWKGLPSYSLDSLCRMHDIRFRHHRAGADAEACAKLVLKAAEAADVYVLNDLLTVAGLQVKAL